MNRNTPWKTLLPLFGALFYGASPIDLIPDIIPILGFVDDALIVPILLFLAATQFAASKRKRQPIATVVQPRRRY